LIPTHAELSVLARRLRARRITLLVAGVYLAAPGLRAGTGAVKTDPPTTAKSSFKSTSHQTKASAPRGKAKSAAWRTGHSASKSKAVKPNGSSHSPDEVRRSAIRPEPQRVQEIQRALIEAGELREEPTGQWDEATRDAMKRYQEGHGFTVTGLPDSKSLMQMGLGPHPLPPEVATPGATPASLGPAVPSAPSPALGGDDSPVNPDPSQQHR
jgi:peptidoglycan hydrolase-like protein with peptidoglycan-binding domain